MSEDMRILPVLAARGIVIFPGMSLQLEIARKKSVMAVKAALEQDRDIFVVTQMDLEDSEPTKDDLYKIGVIAKIKHVINVKDETIKIHIEGLERARLIDLTQDTPYLIAEAEISHKVVVEATNKTRALIRVAKDDFEEYLRWFRNVPSDILIRVVKEKDCGDLADFICSTINVDFEQKQAIMQELDPVKRLTDLCDLLKEEINITEIETEISRKAQTKIDESQREYILREQMKIISSELGEETLENEVEEYKRKIKKLILEDNNKKKLLAETDRLQKMPSSAQESGVIRAYLDYCLGLPWTTISKQKIDLAKAERILERDHFGMKKVKDRFLELLAVKKLCGENMDSQIVCLVGPPGVGKTSIAKSVASAMGRKYARVSLGGVQDIADIMGHRKTYVGAMAGRIISAIKQAGTKNPVILLDEIDKMGQSFKGDPSSSLLEVLDSEQNKCFRDHYVDLDFDLSSVLFITTANDPSYIPSPLYDRMDVINLSSYTAQEKLQIASKYLLPKQLKKHGLNSKQLKLPKASIECLIDSYTKEAGVRSLERRIADICRKTARLIVSNDEFNTVTVKKDTLEEFIGVPKFKRDNAVNTDEVGLINGLAWTSVGGELLPIEVAAIEGTGKIQLTGSLGEVMKESATTAITCIRGNANLLGINSDFYQKYDIHIHAPEGAIPKDGPSAGVAMSVAIASALTNNPIKHNIAITGEVTLQGRVLAIGGLKEKSMAAYKNGIDTVIMPYDNIADISEVDDVVKENITFVPIKKVTKAFELALTVPVDEMREKLNRVATK